MVRADLEPRGARDPRHRLLELANDRGVSLASLSALISRNSTYLQQFVRKGSPRKLEEGDRRTLARFFGISETQLSDGAGLPANHLGQSVGKILRSDWIDIPRQALGASAGPGALDSDERPVGAFRFSAQWLRAQGLDPAMLSAISVTGDSMEPTLRDGDEILVDRAPNPLRDGVHVVRLGEALMVKRLNLGQPGRVVLISDNRAYHPINLSPNEVQIIGRVVWKSGRI